MTKKNIRFVHFKQDYIDAFEKILHLAIKDHRVVVSVIIHCCLSEKAFNPYYAVVAHKFCDYDRKYQVRKCRISTDLSGFHNERG